MRTKEKIWWPSTRRCLRSPSSTSEGAAVAFATIPDSNGVIHACYGEDGGLRLIDDSTASCRPHEKTLVWNQQGGAISGYVGVLSHAHPVAAHTRAEGSVNCPEGLNVLGGGAREEFSLGELVLIGLTYAPLVASRE